MADMDASVICQLSPLEEERGRLAIALSPALHVVCGTRSLSVSGILMEKMFISRRNLIRSCPSTRIYLDVVGLDTHMTEMVANQTLYASITKI